MARHAALIAWAKQMNMTDAAALLSETLQEEIKADQRLSQIGTNDNKKAA
jgi:ferritin-like metal-binding protein YciE